ncbi:MAG: hypothetical protein GEU86_18675 [Actinophytocola sp.]|nr:hypothetical protein [Actinophytocola sp.]
MAVGLTPLGWSGVDPMDGRGQIAEGRIVDLRKGIIVVPDPEGVDIADVDFPTVEFATQDEQTIRAEADDTCVLGDELHRGDTVEVVYDSQNPAVFCLAGHMFRWRIVIVVVGILGTAMGLGMLISSIVSLRRSALRRSSQRRWLGRVPYTSSSRLAGGHAFCPCSSSSESGVPHAGEVNR